MKTENFITRDAKEFAKKLVWDFLPLIEGWTSVDKTSLAKKLAKKNIENILSSYPTTVETFYNNKGLNVVHNDDRTFWREVLNKIDSCMN